MVLLVVGRDFFFIAGVWVKLRSAVRERTRPPQLMHYIRQLMVSLSNFPLHALFSMFLLKKVIPAYAVEYQYGQPLPASIVLMERYSQPLCGLRAVRSTKPKRRSRIRICVCEAMHAAIVPSAGRPLSNCLSEPF